MWSIMCCVVLHKHNFIWQSLRTFSHFVFHLTFIKTFIRQKLNNLQSLSPILISVAPRRPKHSVCSIPTWKQLTFSGTSGPISATTAKLCSSSSISSSTIVKNSGTVNVRDPAGTTTVTGSLLKSATRRKMGGKEEKSHCR